MHPDKPQPKTDKRCKVLILREGAFGEKSAEDTFEFKVDEKGVHKFFAWKEIDK